MIRKITVLGLCAMLFVVYSSARAQQPKKVPRIGFLAGTEGPVVGAFQRGLRDLGYIEGKNIVVEYRYSEGKTERVPSLIAELVQFKVDVLVIIAVPALRAAKQATKTIPIVMVTTVDPVATGLVDSLARPGGNITGITRLTRELSGKRLELLMEILPKISRVGMLWSTSRTLADRELNEYEAAAGALKIPFQSLEVRGPNPDLEGAFREARKSRVSALITTRGDVLVRNAKRIADLATKNRLPLMAEGSDFVEAGGACILCNRRC